MTNSIETRDWSAELFEANRIYDNTLKVFAEKNQTEFDQESLLALVGSAIQLEKLEAEFGIPKGENEDQEAVELDEIKWALSGWLLAMSEHYEDRVSWYYGSIENNRRKLTTEEEIEKNKTERLRGAFDLAYIHIQWPF